MVEADCRLRHDIRRLVAFVAPMNGALIDYSGLVYKDELSVVFSPHTRLKYSHQGG